MTCLTVERQQGVVILTQNPKLQGPPRFFQSHLDCHFSSDTGFGLLLLLFVPDKSCSSQVNTPLGPALLTYSSVLIISSSCRTYCSLFAFDVLPPVNLPDQLLSDQTPVSSCLVGSVVFDFCFIRCSIRPGAPTFLFQLRPAKALFSIPVLHPTA